MLPALALLALAAAVSADGPSISAPIECADSERFTIRVERVSHGPVDGIDVHVQLEGSQGGTAERVRSGLIRVCVHGGTPGMIVSVWLGEETSRAFLLLYPPNAAVVITHGMSPSIVVCQVNSDCESMTHRQIAELFRLLKDLARERGPESRAALIAAWRKLLSDQGMEAGPLVEVLARKERQMKVAGKTLDLLSRFAARTRGLVESFRWHALDAIDDPGAGLLSMLIRAIDRYNEPSDEITERGDSHQMDIAQYWSSGLQQRFRDLREEARGIQSRVYGLMEAKELVSACGHRRSRCADRRAARQRVSDGVAEVAQQIEPLLKDFRQHRIDFLDAINEELFEPGEETATGGARRTARGPTLHRRRP